MKKHLVLAAALLLPAAAFAAEPPLGRLFFTPAQRALLDNARKQNIRADVATDTSAEPTETVVPQTVTVNGLVKRSDGQSAVWVNNKLITDGRSPGGVKVIGEGKSPGSVTLELPQVNRSVQLKVGENFDPATGTLQEGFLAPQPAAGTPAAAKAGTAEGAKSGPAAPPPPAGLATPIPAALPKGP